MRAETRLTVEKAMADLQYIPNPAARSLPSGVSRIVAVVVPDISNPFYAELVRGVQDACDAASFGVMIWSTDGRAEKEAACVAELGRQGVDGVYMVRYLGDVSAFHRLQASNIPIILAGSPSTTVEVDTIGTFGTGASLRELLTPLVLSGRRRLAHIAGPAEAIVGEVRRKQHKAAVRHFGLDFVEEWVVEGDFTREGGREAAKQLLAGPTVPDMVFTANDMMAIGLIEVANEAGMRVTEDLAIIGCDDIDVAGLLRPSLSTIRMPKYELGRKGAELLLQRLTDPSGPLRQLELEVKPIQRESTRIQ